MTEGYACIPHKIWEMDLSPDERYMLLFLMDRENKFNRTGQWFDLTNTDFIDAGFGKNKVVFKRTRESLITKGLIDFKMGGPGKKSQYIVLWK